MFRKHIIRALGETPHGVYEDLTNMIPNSTPLQPNVNPITQASAATLANVITHFVTKVSGTAAMTGFRLPRGFRGIFGVIPTAASTGVTGGTLAYSADGSTEDIPMGLAHTNVIGRVQWYVSDGALVYPTYV